MIADVTDLAQVEAVVDRTVERFGRLDVLISNAGVLAPNGRIHNLTDADWQRVIDINLMGVGQRRPGRRADDAPAAGRARSSSPRRSPG